MALSHGLGFAYSLITYSFSYISCAFAKQTFAFDVSELDPSKQKNPFEKNKNISLEDLEYRLFLEIGIICLYSKMFMLLDEDIAKFQIKRPISRENLNVLDGYFLTAFNINSNYSGYQTLDYNMLSEFYNNIKAYDIYTRRVGREICANINPPNLIIKIINAWSLQSSFTGRNLSIVGLLLSALESKKILSSKLSLILSDSLESSKLEYHMKRIYGFALNQVSSLGVNEYEECYRQAFDYCFSIVDELNNRSYFDNMLIYVH